MKAFEVPEIVINRLKYLARNYDGITHLLVSSKNRLQSINPDSKTDFDDTCQELDRIKNKHTRMLEKELEYWDVWLKWLVNVPGIGPWIGAELILALFYRFPAVCKKCGTLLEKKDKSFWCSHCKKSVKGDGILNYKLEFKQFPNVSSWWKYMGRPVEDGKMPKRQKGVQSDWSTKRRTLGFHIYESFIKQNSGHKYRQIYDERKAYRQETHPGEKKGYWHNMAGNETTKLFLAHYITVAYEIEGIPFSQPYANTIMGHTGYVKPFYCEPSE